MPKSEAKKARFRALHVATPPDVRMLPPHRHAEARGACARRDFGDLRESLPPECFWPFVAANMLRLKHAGLLESLIAYGLVAGLPAERNADIAHALSCAEAWVLRRFGDPLPEGDSIPVYRAMAGLHLRGEVKRLGWLLNPEAAAHEALTKAYGTHWFQRAPMPGVLRLDIARDDVQLIHAGTVYFRVHWREVRPTIVDPMPVARLTPEAEPLAWDPAKCSVGARDGGIVYAFGSNGLGTRCGSNPREVAHAV